MPSEKLRIAFASRDSIDQETYGHLNNRPCMSICHAQASCPLAAKLLPLIFQRSRLMLTKLLEGYTTAAAWEEDPTPDRRSAVRRFFRDSGPT